MQAIEPTICTKLLAINIINSRVEFRINMISCNIKVPTSNGIGQSDRVIGIDGTT